MSGNPLGDGVCVGIVGGGQLGRMICMEARRLGIRTVTLDPNAHAPAAVVSDRHIAAGYGDAEAMTLLAEQADVITYEFENVDARTVEAAEGRVTVRPGSRVLRVAQNRESEKTTLHRLGFPVARFAVIASAEDIPEALERTGLPGILKTATSGYDGKGQHVVNTRADLERVVGSAGEGRFVLEELLDFRCELSVICARGPEGAMVCHGPQENIHHNQILDTTIAPARVPKETAKEAVRLARAITEALDVVGLLAVEMFLTRDGRLLVNELAPRPHNSGHHTLDVGLTSQFEQLLRAICGLPLGEPTLTSPAVMVNLLGDLWLGDLQHGDLRHGSPDFSAALSVPGVRLHLYGKDEPRPGRKMGHLTAVADTPDVALERARRAREIVSRRAGLGRAREIA